ncbi:prolyl tripeptidyl peptidase precursor [mine drainage metagenome]|uniref:Prolyl tripeptidyl peptidase n=1 Tax=mine drainage metagenome TaxID=410659 RepID=A0A1J5PQU7_9ZZZZ
MDSFDLGVPGKDLTPFPGSTSGLQTRIEGSADLLITNNQRDPKVFDLYHYTEATGKLKLLAQNPGDVVSWLTNAQGQLLGRVRKQDAFWVYEKYSPDLSAPWQALFKVDYFDTVELLEVGADSRFVWALSNRGRDKLALVKINLANGQEDVVYADPRVDISQAFISPKTLQPLLLTLDPGYQELKAFDPGLQRALQRLQTQHPGHMRFTPTSMSRDENLITGTVTREDGGQHVLFNVSTGQLTVLGETTPSRIHAISPLPRQIPLAFQSRDGLALHAYLTLPTGTSGKNLPTVLYVHGGPWARDVWNSGDAMPAFLANRGYAVLQVNYRGSSGYGRDFQEAAQGQFAAKMHDDLLDGVDHLVQQGITDPAKVAIMGASYGGYASLVGMTFTPERFACGISMAGMSDLASLIDNAPPYWALSKPWWIRYVGDPANPQDRAVMDSKSPLYRASQVSKPLLILHGVNDPRVKIDQSIRMVQALRKAGKEVDFVVFKGAGHGTQKWSDNLRYYRKTEDFLGRCLGGRSSGFDWFELGSWAF